MLFWVRFVPDGEFSHYDVGELYVVGNFCRDMVLSSDDGIPSVGVQFP